MTFGKSIKKLKVTKQDQSLTRTQIIYFNTFKKLALA